LDSSEWTDPLGPPARRTAGKTEKHDREVPGMAFMPFRAFLRILGVITTSNMRIMTQWDANMREYCNI
jgi:hypothetical protein